MSPIIPTTLETPRLAMRKSLVASCLRILSLPGPSDVYGVFSGSSKSAGRMPSGSIR